MQYQTLLFDLDGTLTDPGEGITNSVSYALERFGISVADRSTLYPFIGPPLIESFMRFFSLSHSDAERAVVYYREYFGDKGLFENKPYDGIHHTLRQLCNAKKRLIVATSKPEPYAKRILDHFDLTPYFAYVAGASFDEKRSEKWDVIRYALDTCRISNTATAVMIGDRKHDVIGAQKNHMDSIGVLWGYGSFDELSSAGATHLVKDQEELIALLTK